MFGFFFFTCPPTTPRTASSQDLLRAAGILKFHNGGVGGQFHFIYMTGSHKPGSSDLSMLTEIIYKPFLPLLFHDTVTTAEEMNAYLEA